MIEVEWAKGIEVIAEENPERRAPSAHELCLWMPRPSLPDKPKRRGEKKRFPGSAILWILKHRPQAGGQDDGEMKLARSAV
jgi:hypothetical protein